MKNVTPNAQVVSTKTVNQSIDIKLTMRDIVDMAMTEKESELEDLVNQTEEKYNQAREKRNKELNKLLTAEYSKIVTKVIKPVSSVVTKEQAIKELLKVDLVHKFRYDYSITLAVYVQDDIKISIPLGRLSDKATKKLKEKQEKLESEVNEAGQNHTDANTELQKWTKQGNRVKAQIIKQQLAQTSEGAEILKQIKGINKKLLK